MTDALREIGAVWNMAERTCEFAAARSRLLLGKLPPLKLADPPSWFGESVNEWDDEDQEILNPSSLTATKRIVQCVAAELPQLRAEVSVGMLGRVVLDWYEVSARCSWMVDPTDVPFPAVRIYEARQVATGELRTRIIHDMYSALEALRAIASETDGK